MHALATWTSAVAREADTQPCATDHWRGQCRLSMPQVRTPPYRHWRRRRCWRNRRRATPVAPWQSPCANSRRVPTWCSFRGPRVPPIRPRSLHALATWMFAFEREADTRKCAIDHWRAQCRLSMPQARTPAAPPLRARTCCRHHCRRCCSSDRQCRSGRPARLPEASL